MKKTVYEKLLKRIDGERSKNSAGIDSRFELPPVDVMWEGQRTYLRNFSDFPKIMRRDSAKLLQYLSKEFAVPAERIGDSAMFIGRRDPDDFTRLLKIYVNDYIMCPTCKSPDTRTEKQKRISFLICEACGAKSTIKGKYS
uniref:Translation initiation factor 2 subunit beta n=3 Tax=environmental samples TaxID=651140 RepID=A0A075H329_9ARCH|nr:translation initiation factor 2, beta subunit/eIF-5 N-terminal domain [uncultured marine thaumarchaeote AD1000_69_E02]AIF08006.1 translation initiation factor 2, beta subunit/eIF-5 N-terminal domain [uncultured marine thaumarchaeote KM3_26_B10]AIF10509.1 translation initiation factor 2, beta subunit/eIF-5 N-terminal domain [uncultured marine thaumarchaeote KM3_46_E07]